MPPSGISWFEYSFPRGGGRCQGRNISGILFEVNLFEWKVGRRGRGAGPAHSGIA